MATWKKVILSGSRADLAQLNVGANQQVSSSAADTFLSGSFSGSFFGNGAGLTGITATFPGSQLTPIIGTTQVWVNDGSNKYATVSQFSSHSWAGISGDILINGSGVATIQANSVDLGTDTTGNYVQSVTAGTGITAIPAASEGAAITVEVSGASTLNANTVVKWNAGDNAFANSLITDNGADVTISGNLIVNGTTVTVSTENLTVSDKFILLASGSTSNTDSGIIVSNAAGNNGTAFYYDGNDTRWALAPSVASNATTATPNSYIVSVSGSATPGIIPAGNPTYGGTSGYGNLFVNTADETVWIYV